jgi:hypothetical protein
VLLIVSLILLNPYQLKAEQEVKVSGTVQLKTDSSLTVNSLEIFVNSTTKISGSMSGNIPYDSVKIGSLVSINAKSNLLGRLLATEIHLITTNIKVELAGTITAVTSNSITVNGTQIFVDTNTIIITQLNTKINFSDLKAGDNVVLKVTESVTGQLTAIIIIVKPETTLQEIELEGRIQAVTSNSIIVLDTEFFIDSQTVIIANKRGLLQLSDLKVGDKVGVRGYMQQDSTYLAIYIKVENEEYESKEIEVEGSISALMMNSFMVNTITFTVDSATVIFSHNGTLLSFSDLKVGDQVKVKAILQSDGSYRAIKIILNRIESEKQIEVTGLIEAVNSDNLIIGGYTIYINSQTKIYINMNQRLSFEDLKVGMFVVVKAYLQDAVYLASQIKVRENDRELNFTGAIESINGSSISVKGLIFVADQNTEFYDDNRNSITINDLKVGQIIKVKAIHQNGNQYLALKIIAKNFWRPTLKLEGTIESLTLTSLTVMGKIFAVNSATLVVGHGTGVITFASLTSGLNVEVIGSLNTGGVLTAKLIKVHPTNEFELHGKIDSITGTSFVVAGLTITTDENTVFFDEFDESIVFADLEVNQFVEVKYIRTSLNENLAVKVEIEKDPKHVQFNGVVTASNNTNIQLSVPSFIINNNTIFLNSDYVPVQSSSIQSGQSIMIWAEQGQIGELTAVQVLQISGSVTSVNNETGVKLPTSYELKQNYPNPFNPTTEIAFSLANKEEVSLVVYNLIGQQIAVLVNGSMNPGSHIVKFNAANMASGVYLYRLTAGNFVSIKKMILLK